MYEYEVIDKISNENYLIFGHSLEDAFSRSRIDSNSAEIIGGPWYDEIEERDFD